MPACLRAQVLRLDGDLYESTIQGLHFLYPSVSAGGHVIVDDFTDWVGCRRATLDFRLVHGIGDSGSGGDGAGEPLEFDPFAPPNGGSAGSLPGSGSEGGVGSEGSDGLSGASGWREGLSPAAARAVAAAAGRGAGQSSETLQVVWHDVLGGEQVRGVWWTKHAASHGYDPRDPNGLGPGDYRAAAQAIRAERRAVAAKDAAAKAAATQIHE